MEAVAVEKIAEAATVKTAKAATVAAETAVMETLKGAAKQRHLNNAAALSKPCDN